VYTELASLRQSVSAVKITSDSSMLDLISYQNDRKGSMTPADKVERGVSEYSTSCIDICASEGLTSADEHAQTRVPIWLPPLPSGRRRPRRHRSSTSGCSSCTPSHPPPGSVFPRARHGRSLPRCGELTSRTPTRHRAPNREPGRILIPGDGAAGDQGAQNRPACPAMAATRRLRPVPSQRLPGAMVSGAHAVVTCRSHRPRST
jgi:hypothetical protein